MNRTLARQTRPVAAALFMLAACLCFSLNSVFVRFASEDVHPFEAAFFRNFFAIGFAMLLVLPKDGAAVFRAVRPSLLMLRAVINTVAMLTWFYSVPLIPLSDLTALGFTAPLWATVLAAIFLGEKIRLRRGAALAFGFAGALIIIQPGFKELHWATYLVLVSSACWGLTVIIVRRMTSIERPNTILVYQSIMMSLLSIGPALYFWQPPTVQAWTSMLVLGALSATAHWCHVRAYSMQEVAALQPLDFTRLPIIAVAAWVLFGEIAGTEIWLGAVVVFGAGTYISYREAQLRKQGLSP